MAWRVNVCVCGVYLYAMFEIYIANSIALRSDDGKEVRNWRVKGTRASARVMHVLSGPGLRCEVRTTGRTASVEPNQSVYRGRRRTQCFTDHRPMGTPNRSHRASQPVGALWPFYSGRIRMRTNGILCRC